jgi:hypothetical protein
VKACIRLCCQMTLTSCSRVAVLAASFMVLVLAETIKLEKLLDSGDQLFEVNNRIKRLETELLAANAERNQLLKRVNGRVSKTSIARNEATKLQNFAYVTLVTGSAGYATGALALGNSLKKVGSRGRLICLITETTSPSAVNLLVASGVWEIVVVSDLPCSNKADKRCNKLAMFDNVMELQSLTRYIFLDADTYVRENLDHLFSQHTEWPIVGARNCPLSNINNKIVDPCNLPPGEYGIVQKALRNISISLDPDNFNSGFMLIDPNLVSSTDVLGYVAEWNSTWDGDQDPLNELFGSSPRLGIDYNTLLCCSDFEAMGKRGRAAKVIHFSSRTKPWDAYRFETQLLSGTVAEDHANPDFKWWEKNHPFFFAYNEWKQVFVNGLNDSLESCAFEL